MTARPTEVKAIAELLNQPADDVNDLAKRAIHALDEMRKSRTQYAILVLHTGAGYAVYGPYDTPNQARKDVGKNIIAAGPGSKAGLYTLIKASEVGASD